MISCPHRKPLRAYRDLISDFISGSITAEQFRKRYLEMYQKESAAFGKREAMVLEHLFFEVELFSTGPDSPFSDDELKGRCEIALQNLRKF